jgi:hypothetical protein
MAQIEIDQVRLGWATRRPPDELARIKDLRATSFTSSALEIF